MKAATYAKAIDRLVEAGTDQAKLAENLLKNLSATGRMKLLPGILGELKAYEARRQAVAPRVEVAHEKDASAALAAAKAEGITAEKAHVNHSLIRGWRARSRGTLVDRSSKRALIDLYRRIAN
ncbi:MAG TPA: hypothetical protein PK109_00020 [Candidatus Paceibacterota bacterium]|nr:hypothetical protein [Candidatus Paceibacterota bacterium]